MDETEFAALTLSDKWFHLKTIMDYVVKMDSAYSLRVRLNHHHPSNHQKQEERNLRLDQYQRWSHVKNLYAAHRDEMVNTLDSTDFEKCKSILERIFTMELDDVLRDVIDG